MGERTLSSAFVELIRRKVPTQAERDAAASHRASVEAALEPLEIFGLWETGSFRHGTAVRGHCDIDVLVSLKGTRSSADAALERVKTALQRRFPYTNVRVSRPAVVADFAGGAERWEVIPAYFARSVGNYSVYAIPAPGGTWIETAPQAHLDYVTSENQEPAGGAKNLARLMKAYKYANASGFRVSSFYLEMRATRYMADESVFLADIDFVRLGERLASRELAAMYDPLGITGRIAATSTESYRRDALTRLSNDMRRAREALNLEASGRVDDAFEKMSYVFCGDFPSRYF